MVKNGFTLVEVVLATAIIAVVGVLSAGLIISIFKSHNHSNSVSQVNRVGQSLVDVFERQVRNATSVSVVSSHEIQYVIPSDAGQDIQYSLKYIPKNCTADNSNSFISLSSLVGSSFPEDPITPTDINTGVNVTGVTFVQDSVGIKFDFTLQQACNLPLKKEFMVNKSYTSKIVPRFNYGN